MDPPTFSRPGGTSGLILVTNPTSSGTSEEMAIWVFRFASPTVGNVVGDVENGGDEVVHRVVEHLDDG